MIRAYSLSAWPVEGLHLYQEMRRRNRHPNSLSSSFAIKSFSRFCSLSGALQMHARIVVDGHQSDTLLLTTLMGAYSVCEDFDKARTLFDEIPQKDTVAWNVMISCCIRNKRCRDALLVFNVMQTEPFECRPDQVTCLHLLQACAHLCAVDFGMRVHNYIDENGFGSAVNVSNSLITMYSKCGYLDKAYEVFTRVHEKNVVTWSAIISGFAVNGYGREAIEAFREMRRVGVPPDDQSFTGVLSACSHCGFVDEGLMFFECMSKEFGIIPNIYHYGCVVDLLGRAGLLDRAYCLIRSMRVKPDPTLWRTLLGSCRIHRHFILGERVVSHLIELKAEEAGDYVLLLNIFSSIGNWEKVGELRKFIKEKGIRTTPASSTIELQGKIHEFITDDISHPRKHEIYQMLDEIGKQLKIAGYVTDFSSELHNLGEEEKETRLTYHSEKLAIAFGVLATPPGTTIRVAKDLRICLDCHNFAKVLSGVYDRTLIIRDRTRFHHFRGGRCSCNDYW